MQGLNSNMGSCDGTISTVTAIPEDIIVATDIYHTTDATLFHPSSNEGFLSNLQTEIWSAFSPL